MRLRMWMRCWPIAVCVIAGGCTWHVRESNLLFPRATGGADLARLQMDFPEYERQELHLPASAGAMLYGLSLKRADARATVLYFGGNGYRISRDGPATVRAYRALPVNLILVDHRGYGGSTGTPTMALLMADAVGVYDAIAKDARFSSLPIIVHGHSLGSFMAGEVARERRLDGVVLESTVTTTEEWTRFLRSRQAWWARALVWRVVPERSLANKGNLSLVAALDEPTLFVVGADDVVTPPDFSRRMYEVCPLPASRKRLLVVPGASHMNAAQAPAFHEAMAGFIELSREQQELMH